MRALTTDAAVIDGLVSPEGKDVLDVGCGDGALVRRLCAAGARATGLEISEDKLAIARERDPVDADRFLLGRAEKLPVADASVDIVVFMRALHHVAIDQITGALREARRVLRHGGAVYVAEPLTEGDFFELTSLVEDEREVRRAVQDAIERAGEAGLERTNTVEYLVEARFGGVAAFEAMLVRVDPDRARVISEREREIASAFERLGEPGTLPGERCFRQPMRVDILRPHTQARTGADEERGLDASPPQLQLDTTTPARDSG